MQSLHCKPLNFKWENHFMYAISNHAVEYNPCVDKNCTKRPFVQNNCRQREAKCYQWLSFTREWPVNVFKQYGPKVVQHADSFINLLFA